MKRLVLFLLLCAGLTFALGEEPKADQKMNAGIISGKISLPEIYGAVSVGNRLLVAADDPERKDKQFHMIALLEDAVARLESKQDIIVDPAEQIYKNLLHKDSRTRTPSSTRCGNHQRSGRCNGISAG